MLPAVIMLSMFNYNLEIIHKCDENRLWQNYCTVFRDMLEQRYVLLVLSAITLCMSSMVWCSNSVAVAKNKSPFYQSRDADNAYQDLCLLGVITNNTQYVAVLRNHNNKIDITTGKMARAANNQWYTAVIQELKVVECE